jgi:hypothetical protein
VSAAILYPTSPNVGTLVGLLILGSVRAASWRVMSKDVEPAYRCPRTSASWQHVIDAVEAHKPVSAQEWQEMLVTLELPQRVSGQIFGASKRTGESWAAGRSQVGLCVEIVARLMIQLGLENPLDLLSLKPEGKRK